MKMFCISDNIDTAVGLKMVGIDYVILKEKEKIELEIQEIIKDKTIGILIVTENVYENAKNEFKKIEQRKFPLIIKVPNPV